MNQWIIDNLPLKELLNVEKCLVKEKYAARQKPIKLIELTSAFFVLGIGACLAIISFLCEVIYFKFQQKEKRDCDIASVGRGGEDLNLICTYKAN